jgi:hypothetical protein
VKTPETDKKNRPPAAPTACSCTRSTKADSLFSPKLLQTVGAYILTLIDHHVLGIIAENAGRLVLFQDNGSAVHIDLERVALRDVQGTAQLDGQHDASEFVYFTYDSS